MGAFSRPRGFLNYANVWQALGAAGVLAHFNSEELVATAGGRTSRDTNGPAVKRNSAIMASPSAAR